MNQIKKRLAFVVLALSFSQISFSQKVVHINLDDVVVAMPEAKTMQTELEKLGKSYETEITAAREALKAKYDRYTAEETTKTPEENQQRAAEVQQEQQKIQQLQSVAQQELQKKQNDLLEPIIKKAQDAIKAYAVENKIQYVLDARTLIYAEGENITELIKKKLNIVK